MVEQFWALGPEISRKGKYYYSGVCVVVSGFRWGLGWSKMIEIEIRDTLKVS